LTVRKGIEVGGCFCVECVRKVCGPRLYSSVGGEKWAVKVEVREAHE